MSPKNPKKRSDPAVKELKAIAAKLRAQLERAESRVEKLKSKVGGHEAARAELEKQVQKLTRKLEKAKAKAPAPVEAPAPDASPATEPATASDVPGPSWTVARLRSEVQARGIAGVPSRATKAQLLAVLTQPPAAD